MEKLRLPVIKGPVPTTKWLTMDDYIKFVNLNLKYTLKRKTYRKRQKLLAVNVPFSL